MNLYGNDIDEDTTPFEAELDFVVKLDNGDFIGRTALVKQKEESVSKRRVGLKMIDRAVPRQGCEVYKLDECVGVLTSGTFSPLLKYGIAMGYVRPEDADEGEILEVKIRQRLCKAEVVKMPFYDTEKYGWNRKS
jgi:aminomethyltransferase